MPNLVFGEVISSWMERNGLNAFRAQSHLQATDSTIINWTKGTSLPPSTRIPFIAATLGVPVETLAKMVAHARRRRVVAGGRRVSCPKRRKGAGALVHLAGASVQGVGK